MKKHAKSLIVLAVAMAALAATANTLVATEGEAPFQTLARERVSSDELPKAVTQSPVAQDLGREDTSRRVGVYHGTNYYLVKGKDGRVCLVGYEQPALVRALCVPWRGDSLSTLIYHATVDPQGDRVFAVLAPDGYDHVELTDKKTGQTAKVAVRSNVAFFTTNRAASVTLSGPGQALPPMTVPRFGR